MYIYIYIYTSSGFLQQDLESSYSFAKIQRTVVCPIVFNLFNLSYLSYLMEMYFLLIRDAFLNHFPMKTAVAS